MSRRKFDPDDLMGWAFGLAISIMLVGGAIYAVVVHQ